jgi:hypothetical protein
MIYRKIKLVPYWCRKLTSSMAKSVSRYLTVFTVPSTVIRICLLRGVILPPNITGIRLGNLLNTTINKHFVLFAVQLEHGHQTERV